MTARELIDQIEAGLVELPGDTPHQRIERLTRLKSLCCELRDYLPEDSANVETVEPADAEPAGEPATVRRPDFGFF